MKKDKIIFWVFTGIIFLMEGVMPALTFNTELAKSGIKNLGYPEYFGNALIVFKIIGVLAIVIPQIPHRIKEWAYAGFLFNFIFAFISHACVEGITVNLIMPIVIIGILAGSYIYFHKLKNTPIF